MSTIGLPELLAVAGFVAMAALVIWPSARLCKRLGLSPWLSILVVVPFANVLLLWFVAMSPWPKDHRSG